MMRSQLLRRASTLSKIAARSALPLTTRQLQTSNVRLAAATAIKGEDYIKHHSQVKKPSETFNFLDNKFQSSKTSRWIDLHDPATQNVVTRVPETTQAELKAAVDSAEKAFKTWKNTSLLSRQQILFRLAYLIRENWDRLAASITLEQVSSISSLLTL
jgi:malonate-semialdehyde dehydrogenase (acetylating) / methylmalonate-semialdehyde dehydrogenase